MPRRPRELPADDPRGRGDGDDLAAPLPAHHGQDRPGHVERPEEVGLHLCPELAIADLFEVAGVEVAGIVYERVDPSEPLDRRVSGGLSGGRVRDVERDGQKVVVLAEGCGHLGGVAGGSDDIVARIQSRPSQVDAHAARGPGDQPDSAEIGHETSALRRGDAPERGRRSVHVSSRLCRGGDPSLRRPGNAVEGPCSTPVWRYTFLHPGARTLSDDGTTSSAGRCPLGLR